MDCRRGAGGRSVVGPVDSGDQRALERLVLADQRDHSGDGCHDACRARALRRVRTRPRSRPPRRSRPSETRADSRRATRVPYDPMREPTAPAYYDRRAPEYDDWYLGQGLYAGRERERFDDDLADVRCSPPASGTNARRRVRHGLPDGICAENSRVSIGACACSRSREQGPRGDLVEGDAPGLPRRRRARSRRQRPLLWASGRRPADRSCARHVVGREIVLVDAARERAHTDEEWSTRVLRDGSTWQVQALVHPDGLLGELGEGEILHAGLWFSSCALRVTRPVDRGAPASKRPVPPLPRRWFPDRPATGFAGRAGQLAYLYGLALPRRGRDRTAVAGSRGDPALAPARRGRPRALLLRLSPAVSRPERHRSRRPPRDPGRRGVLCGMARAGAPSPPHTRRHRRPAAAHQLPACAGHSHRREEPCAGRRVVVLLLTFGRKRLAQRRGESRTARQGPGLVRRELERIAVA